MSQDIKALEIARNVKPRTVGAFMTGPSNQDCFNAANCIEAQADRIEALERQLAALRQAPEWISGKITGGDVECNSVTISIDGDIPRELWTIGNRAMLAAAPSAGQAKPDDGSKG